MHSLRLILVLVLGAAAAPLSMGYAGSSPDSLSAGSSMNSAIGTFADPRDGQTYRWVRIGDQVWMAENLRLATDDGSWCWDNEESMCRIRGRLYNWDTAQTVAPAGWHLPTDKEWKALEIQLGLSPEETDRTGDRGDESGQAAGKLKAPGSWPTQYEGNEISVTDETGFSAVPSGVFALDLFSHDGYAAWWTSTEAEAGAWIRVLRFFDNRIDRVVNNKVHGFAIRCVKDAEQAPEDSN